MKKMVSLLLTLSLLLSVLGAAVAEGYTPGDYAATAKGFMGNVTIQVTLDENGIVALTADSEAETPEIGGVILAALPEALAGLDEEAAIAKVDDLGEDVMSTATFAFATRAAVQEALAACFAQAKGESADAEVAFTAGTYTATAAGYNGDVTLNVTFSDTALTAIEVAASRETDHVGTPAYDIMIPDMIAANGSGVDAVSGATFTSLAIRNAVNDAAEQAGCTNLAAFKAATVEKTPGETIEETYDVVVIGAGGAGVAAAAQAAQDGNTVLIIEKNAEVGGNTLVSGGQYQSVMPYLVWDPADPDATTGVGYDGNTYNKVKSVQGCAAELRMILGWSEEPFDAAYYVDHEYVAGDAAELSRHGVHEDYLPVLQALKAEIQAYLDWADPQLEAGVPENQLTLFSTLNLHIFQTYYGGLRQSADGSEWIYGDVALVRQFIEGGQELKQWLEAQGSTFVEDTQPTLIGALWYRENEFIGATIDGVSYPGRWGTYFQAPLNTILVTSETAASNKVMLRTNAEELLVENNRIAGVRATMFDGTPVIAHATKGVIIATGGYAANIAEVVESNVYWSEEYLSSRTKTTNRSSLQGDGIEMAQAVGAGVTGMGFTQLMPISWVDNGNLAFGGGNYAVYINPTTGHRFVDEGSERDVLSLNEFRNGVEVGGTKGVFMEIYNASELIPGPIQLGEGDFAGRYYRRTPDQLSDLLAELGFEADANTIIDTIRAYDMAVMTGSEYPDVGKAIASRTIGNVDKNEDGSYNVDSYDLDGTLLTIRLMAPSTHHTMGGILVDTDRHVLTATGNIIPGLYAAGEVTGGIHGGNRLGGNAIVEIFVSGRTAAIAVNADAE